MEVTRELLEASALQAFSNIAACPHEAGTLGDVLNDIKIILMEAKKNNCSDKKIASLPMVYWNRGNRRAKFNLCFMDRRNWIRDAGQPITDADGSELAKLPSYFYVELFDATLPLVKADEGEA